VSFASEPERDDGSLPRVNIVVPDDARELDRDVLAYRREMRAQRRRQRLMRLLRPFNRSGIGGPVAIVPLIALCLALALVGGALLSVVTTNPADPPYAQPTGPALLPAGSVLIAGKTVSVRSLTSSVLVLVSPGCECGLQLDRLAVQAVAAQVPLYFVGTGVTSLELKTDTTQYGDGRAVAADEVNGVLGNTYGRVGLVVLLVSSDAKAEVHKILGTTFQLGPLLRELKSASVKTDAQPTPEVGPTGG
jgi:hypothetical protein